VILFLLFYGIFPVAAQGTVSGELKKWHTITITFDGPSSSETATPNPFLDYRLDVTFTNGTTSYTVPGYFAADGDAANTGAVEGNKWRVHFCPDQTGTWSYTTRFRYGTDIAVSDDPQAGESVASIDGVTGSFDITATDKTGRDNRGKGRLQYVGEHYLQWAETGEYFLKQGPDAPENLLAYEEFDGDFKSDGNKDNLVKDWQPHVGDWNTGDPTWSQLDGTAGTYGKGIIGAINYLASEGMNAFSFLTMNIAGDDRNAFPYRSYSDYTRMDCSRLDQWELVFEHADHMGMFLHFKTQETENDHLLDDGSLGVERKLYYRELIARFAHHLALNWNLGEENTNSTEERIAFAQYFRDHDPYDHHLVIHTYPHHYYSVYDALMGNASELTGASLQTSNSGFTKVHERVGELVEMSASRGRKWAVACDEPGDASHALRPDNDAGTSHTDGRKNALWGTLMAGGWGNEWYFGYQHDHSDLTCTDWRSRDQWWDQCRFALDFFTAYVPFWAMVCKDELIGSADGYCFAGEGSTYVVYLKNGGSAQLDLSEYTAEFAVRWFDPRNGGELISGTAVSGGSSVTIGPPPSAPTQDWAALITRQEVDDDTPPAAPSNLQQESATNRSVTLVWDAAIDNESGIKQYKVFVDGALTTTVSSTQATLTGLSRNTAYQVAVSAVNWADLESPRSETITATTADLDCPANTLFLRASEATLENGMTLTEAAGALSGSAFYGTDGSTSSASSSHSTATFTVEIPTEGTYVAWFRTRYDNDQANSFWIAVDGASTTRITNGSTFGTWHWEGHMNEGAVSLGTLSAGQHTVVVTVREPAPESLIDIVCITSNATLTPTDEDVCFNDPTPVARSSSTGVRSELQVGAMLRGMGIRVTGARPAGIIEVLRPNGALVSRAAAGPRGDASISLRAPGAYIVLMRGTGFRTIVVP
jgi:hypothetical protein